MVSRLSESEASSNRFFGRAFSHRHTSYWLSRAKNRRRRVNLSTDCTSTMNYVPLRSTRIPLPTARSSSSPLNNVHQKLATLALRLEKELQSEATTGDYYGPCAKCGQSVIDSSNACQAMGEIYHNHCFTCCICRRILLDKTFYRVRDQTYCEEDYLVCR